jgi:hypothetical protein
MASEVALVDFDLAEQRRGKYDYATVNEVFIQAEVFYPDQDKLQETTRMLTPQELAAIRFAMSKLPEPGGEPGLYEEQVGVSSRNAILPTIVVRVRKIKRASLSLAPLSGVFVAKAKVFRTDAEKRSRCLL